MGLLLFCISIAILLAVLIKGKQLYNQKQQRIYQRRLSFIETFQLKDTIIKSFQKHYPMLIESQIAMVVEGFRQFLQVILEGDRLVNKRILIKIKPIFGMPSKVVDDLWHEFILDSRAYMSFCNQAFGYYLHHHPANPDVVYQRQPAVNSGLFITWYYACQLNHQNDLTLTTSTSNLPLLFLIDNQLNIKEGYSYCLEDFEGWKKKNSQSSNCSTGGGGGSCSNNSSNDGAGDSGCGGCGGGGD